MKLPGWRLDVAIAAVVFVASSAWAATFWNVWKSQGNEPEFYQLYFEPSVMVACGKGFGLTNAQPKPLEDFVQRRADRFDCGQLPADLKLDRTYLYQAAWTYLLYTVGYFWRVFGVSWSGMGPLFGVFFGSVTALAYGIFRLGMGRVLATLGAAAIATSALHLVNLPHLRDYSKAPFTLALFLILGVLAARTLPKAAVVALAAAYGAVLGFGYGFRTDLLIDLPLVVIVLFAFLPGGFWRNLVLKTAATAAFIVAFVVVSYPITSAVAERGGCQWHVSLLGLQSIFEDRLRIAPAPYDFGHVYADGYVIRTVRGFAERMQPGVPEAVYCSPEYDYFSGRYLAAIVTTFPADMVARAYASVLQVSGAAFEPNDPPAREWAARIFSARDRVTRMLRPMGASFVVAAVLGAAAGSLRLGLFLLFFVAYVAGYPAVQFQSRHYFHLEFMGLWALGFLLQQAVDLYRTRREMAWSVDTMRPMAMRALAVAAVGIVAGAGLIWTARLYQTGETRELFRSYAAADKERLGSPSAPLPDSSKLKWPQLLEVDVDGAACGASPSVTFTYNQADHDGNFTRTISVPQASTGPGLTRIFHPVFEGYTGLAVSDMRPGCVAGVYRVTSLNRSALLLTAALPPDWESRPLHQGVWR